VLALWSELAFDLDELDDYGGGDDATEDHVAELLDQIRTQLDSKKVGSDHRREILDRVLPFIESGNAGMDDILYEVAYAACYDDSNLRELAEAFEAMQGDWKTANARGIYRRIGDRNKYLELRTGHMEYGADYHDLATFYWESGEKEKSLQVAEKGLRKGKGRMDELRRFVSDRAEESGDREKYLALQFAQATDALTLKKYKEYARKAKVMAKVHRLLVEVIGDEARWKKFAAKVKQDNMRRPAFQEEFARTLPGWRELN